MVLALPVFSPQNTPSPPATSLKSQEIILFSRIVHSPLLPTEDMLQEPWGMPKTMQTIEPIHTTIFLIHIYLQKSLIYKLGIIH